MQTLKLKKSMLRIPSPFRKALKGRITSQYFFVLQGVMGLIKNSHSGNPLSNFLTIVFNEKIFSCI